MKPAAFRPRQTLLCALAAFVLIQGTLAVVVLRHPDLPHEDLWQRRTRGYHRRVERSPDALRVVQIGSSRTECGLCGGAAEPGLSERLGRPVMLFNMGAQGSGPAANLINLRRRLNDGVRPHLLLVEVLPPLLHDDDVQEDLLPQRLPAAELRPGEVRCASRVARRERPWLWAEWLRDQSLPASTHRQSLLSVGYPRLLSADARRDGLRGADESGYVPTTKLSNERSARALASARERYEGVLRDFRLSPRRLRLVGQTLDEARREGMAVALVVMPEGPTFRSWYAPGAWEATLSALEVLASVRGVPVINLREALDEADFFDSHHPTTEGAAKLTQKLGRRIEPLLRDLDAR